MSTPPPVFLLDVDGVINANRPSWGAPPRQGYAYADCAEWRMRWAPSLVDRLRTLHTGGHVELRWCTTWCDHADQLERLFGFPRLVRAFGACGDQAPELKFAAAVDVVASGRGLIWADDDAIPRSGPEVEELLAAGALLIRPDARRGLQPADLDLIDGWLAARWRRRLRPSG